MSKKLSAAEVVKHLDAAKSDRQKITVYLSRSLFERFKNNCGEHSPSQVLEELMKRFLAK